jgi:hypothetical protein
MNFLEMHQWSDFLFSVKKKLKFCHVMTSRTNAILLGGIDRICRTSRKKLHYLSDYFLYA